MDQSSQIQSISQNQYRTLRTTPSVSKRSGLILTNHFQYTNSRHSRKRKLPRDFQLTNDLYRINNFTNNNNALSNINEVFFDDHQDTDSVV